MLLGGETSLRCQPAVRRGPAWIVFFFLFLVLVYNSNLRPIASGDSLPGSLIPFSVWLDSSITLDRFGPYLDTNVTYSGRVVQKTGGHWYSWYPIAGPLLSTPLYFPLAVLPRVRSLPPGSLIAVARIAEKLVSSALAAVAAVALLPLLRRIVSERAAWLLTLVFAFATGNWSTSSQAFWQHTFGVPLIVGCFYAVDRFDAAGGASKWYWLAGASAGCAIAVRPTNIALLVALILVLSMQRAPAAKYVPVCLPVAVALLPVIAYNLYVFQNPFGAYGTRSSPHVLAGLAGILVSPGRGVLVYTPIAIFSLCALSAGARQARARHWELAAVATVSGLLQIVFASLWPVWWGGYCWGPRLLTDTLPSMVILTAIGFPAIRGAARYAFAAAAVYGFLIQALGVYCYPKGRWDHLPVSVDNEPGRLWNWSDNPIARTAHGGIAWEPYAILLAGAKGGLPAAAEKLHELGINAY